MAKKPTQIYQIKVTLDDTHPPIWRRILVPGNTTLLKLHDILQIVLGWEDYHLHMYTIAGMIYGNPADDEYDDLGILDEAYSKLSQVVYREGQRFGYEYDFGDSWDHTLVVEKILPSEEGVRYPLCLKGKRACPPEDVSGVWGYENFLKAIRDPSHDEHEEYLNWIGGEFDPEAFDLEEVNTRLRSMGRGRSAEALNAWSVEENSLFEKKIDLISPWSQTLPDDQQAVVEELPLRRDVITLLSYLRDNKVTGTQSTGNLPLKAVHEICARFVNPPKLEEAIGEHVYRVRSETEVWPLFFRHVLASMGGLAAGGLGRRWKLTNLGERFLAAPAPLQVWLLFVAWWTQTNWAIATPYSFEDGYPPAGFSRFALKHLLDLPVGDRLSFEPIADRMIEASGMTWPSQDQDRAHSILRSIIERIVIDPLVDFGILQTEYEPHKILGAEFRELSAFRITLFGRGVLEAINDATK
ncbi:MAG TPA: plasmid pRiA4b ORF-3 family protein [Anaerolineales bacterium]|nr:plasmid pRiA4b ORF-3 family protein [Anaerolineales bacterium]